jgi:Family of unknown function (DUF5684)
MDSSVSSVIGLVVALVGVVGLWRVFAKAGRPGWGAIIPIYNVYLLVKVAGRPGWWVLLYLVPVVNIVIHAIVAMDVARNFGKSKTFGIVGLWLFSVIGFVILGFSDARYVGERGAADTSKVAAAY